MLLRDQECRVHDSALTLGKCVKYYCSNVLACILYARRNIMTAKYPILLVKQLQEGTPRHGLPDLTM